MEDRRGEHCARAAFEHGGGKVLNAARAAAGDHRDGDGGGDGLEEGDVISGLGAVAVHRGEQDFAGAFRGREAGEVNRVNARRLTAALGEDLPMVAGLAGVDGHHHALPAGLGGAGGNEVGV